MNTGKTLFAQLMDFLPWTTFTRIVDRYGGDHRVRTLSCAEQYRSMAFAQLTYRESLRDIETCLSVHASKLYHMGFRQPVRHSTLADANERRDWRIHAALAQRLITQARTLYVDEELGLDLTNTVYALDSTTIALCLSVFPWAHFRTTKAAVKMHTLLDLRGNIPSFIHISDGKLHDVHALDMLLPEAGAIYVVDRGYVDFARLYVLHQAGAFPYLHNGEHHDYLPDFVVQLICDEERHLILETKGYDPLEDVKTQAAQRWVHAVNAGGSFGTWDYVVVSEMSEVGNAVRRAAGSGP